MLFTVKKKKPVFLLFLCDTFQGEFNSYLELKDLQKVLHLGLFPVLKRQFLISVMCPYFSISAPIFQLI